MLFLGGGGRGGGGKLESTALCFNEEQLFRDILTRLQAMFVCAWESSNCFGFRDMESYQKERMSNNLLKNVSL